MSVCFPSKPYNYLRGIDQIGIPPPSRKPNPNQTPLKPSSIHSQFTLSDGYGSYRNPKKKKMKPLSDDDARRIIRNKSQYLSLLRFNQGPRVEAPCCIRQTPEQIVRYLVDDRRWRRWCWWCGGSPGGEMGEYDMREVMGSFIGKLSSREMCVVLKEQRGWWQVRDFFEWCSCRNQRENRKMQPIKRVDADSTIQFPKAKVFAK